MSVLRQREFHLYPFFAFQKSEKGELKSIRKTSDQVKEEEKEERVILCKNCKNRITSHKYSIEISGQHQHAFANPAGIVYQIRCFSLADGCINRGVPTTEFTWFEGFSWRFSLCSRCNIHLGWFYQSKGEKSFYGLVVDNLTEGI